MGEATVKKSFIALKSMLNETNSSTEVKIHLYNMVIRLLRHIL